MPSYSAIKKCAYQQFESKDAFSLHMVKDTADLLYAIACLLQRSVVKYVTALSEETSACSLEELPKSEEPYP